MGIVLSVEMNQWCGGTGPAHRLWLNRALFWILRAEALYLSKAGRSLAFGHTTFCLGQRPHGPAPAPAEPRP